MSYLHFNEAFERVTYPVGERHTRARNLDTLRGISTIEAQAHRFDDLCEIVTADRILRRNDINIEWYLPYFPFARHDRRIDESDGFEIELALELVRELDLVIADPHSEVSGMLPHFSQASTVEIMRGEGACSSDPIVVIPDAGAAKKATEWVGGADAVQALKRRDPRTGKLSRFEVIAESLGGRPCVIVDDICDGGGTFLGLAERLRTTHDAGPLTLIVTHGMFTKGLDELTQAFDRIYTFAPTDTVPLATTTGCLSQLPYRVLYEKGIRR